MSDASFFTPSDYELDADVSMEEVVLAVKEARSGLSMEGGGKDYKIARLAEVLAEALDGVSRDEFWLTQDVNYRNEFYEGAAAALKWFEKEYGRE